VTRNDQPASVEDRLRAALEVDLGAIREGVDMSSEAVTARLLELGEISSLCLQLGSARASLGLPRTGG